MENVNLLLFFQNSIEFDRIFISINTNEIQSNIYRSNKATTSFISRRIMKMSYYLKAQSLEACVIDPSIKDFSQHKIIEKKNASIKDPNFT